MDEPPCRPDCQTCADLPRPGEPWDAYLARLGAAFRAATEAVLACQWCGQDMTSQKQGPVRKWCSARCSRRAYEARKASA